MKLWLVRHAQPLVEAGVCYGQQDLPADVKATMVCAQTLAAQLPAQIKVISSPLQRCTQLSRALQTLRPDLTVVSDDRLQEMDFGQWEGRPWSQIDKAEIDAWTADFAHYRVGHHGESSARFMARVAAAFDALPRAADTLWVTHAGVIRAAALLAAGIRTLEHAAQWPVQAPGYGQWCKLELA